MRDFEKRLQWIKSRQENLLRRSNVLVPMEHGWFHRYQYPVLTAEHVPYHWKFDLDPVNNPNLLQRIGINAVLNAGAIRWKDKYVLAVRVEGYDRKSFFALAESPNGIDQFRFRDLPIVMPETDVPDTNIYDMRLVAHEDGWIYGLFCTERRAPDVPEADQSSAVAQCGIARTKDLEHWERLPDLVSSSPQQRNVVLHPEFIDGRYALYTRPQDSFIEAGRGGGIGFGLTDSMEKAVVEEELIMDPRHYHTISELKNGAGPAPLKTSRGWLHLAHGVRNTAAGFRYVLYMFLTDLKRPDIVTHKPAGYFLAPEGEERVGDVSNVVFSNGWIMDEDGRVLIYYASSDTRLHVASTQLDILLDYVMNSPADGFNSFASASSVYRMASVNLARSGGSTPALCDQG